MIVGGPSSWHFLLDAKGEGGGGARWMRTWLLMTRVAKQVIELLILVDAMRALEAASTFQEHPKYGEAQVEAS